MNQSEATKAKFMACTGTMEYLINRWEQVEEGLNLDKQINIEAFKKMLIKNDMEEYFTLLLNHLGSFQFSQLPNNWQKEISIDDLEHKKDLTEALIFLLSNEAGMNSSITFAKSKNSLTISNKNIIDSIIKGLVTEYGLNNFNLDCLTDEELDRELEKDINQKWIEDWINKDQERFMERHLEDHSKNYETDFYNMSAKFWEEHPISREVNLDLLNRIKKDFYSGKKKPGRKQKNMDIAMLAKGLVRLKKIDKYLSSSSHIIDIDKIPLSSEDCRFVHDCLATFKLIEDYSKNESNSTTPAKYIRTLLRQSPQPFDFARNKNYWIIKFIQLKSSLNNIG